MGLICFQVFYLGSKLIMIFECRNIGGSVWPAEFRRVKPVTAVMVVMAASMVQN